MAPPEIVAFLNRELDAAIKSEFFQPRVAWTGRGSLPRFCPRKSANRLASCMAPARRSLPSRPSAITADGVSAPGATAGAAIRAGAMSELSLDGALADGRHVMQVRVYYEDTDFSGAVYHAGYLRFMERGRTNYLRLLGVDQRGLFAEAEREAPGFAFVVRSMTLDFLKPAAMNDLLTVTSRAEEVKGASITLHQTVTRGDDLVVEAHVRVAFVSGGRARPIPKALRQAMKADQAAPA